MEKEGKTSSETKEKGWVTVKTGRNFADIFGRGRTFGFYPRSARKGEKGRFPRNRKKEKKRNRFCRRRGRGEFVSFAKERKEERKYR